MDYYYYLVYLVTNLFGTYIVYKFMKVFFRARRHGWKEWIIYTLYFAIVSALYIFVDIPVVMMISNLLLFFAITGCYEEKLKKRIAASLLIYIVLMGVEELTCIWTGHYNIMIDQKSGYASSFGLITIRMISFLIVVGINNIKRIRERSNIPTRHWICICTIPVSSLVIILVLFKNGGIGNLGNTIFITMLLLINFVAFYLHDAILEMMAERIEKTILERENAYYYKQMQLMQNSLRATRTVRHDLKHHFGMVKEYIRQKEYGKAEEYVGQILDSSLIFADYARTGNVDIDSIINFNLPEIRENHIAFEMDILVPAKMSVKSSDLSIILGNLLDNAVEAVKKFEEGRRIELWIRYNKGRLVIKIQNFFQGEVWKENGKIVTSKNENAYMHGIGLQSVLSAVERYDGSMEVRTEDQIFVVKIIMFVEEEKEDFVKKT